MAGIAVVFGDQLSADVPLVTPLALMGGALCAAEVPPLIKLIPRGDPITINALGMLVAGVLLVTVSALAGESLVMPRRGETLTAVLFLIVLGTVVVDFLYVFAIRRWTASAASYALKLIAPLTAIYGLVLLGEEVSPLFVVGAAVILIGVWLGALSTDRRRVPLA